MVQVRNYSSYELSSQVELLSNSSICILSQLSQKLSQNWAQLNKTMTEMLWLSQVEPGFDSALQLKYKLSQTSFVKDSNHP